MSWVVLALTLGAAITSIIHGVFMLFGSLSISGGAIFGIPANMLASLPIISAIFALIGGVIAFNGSKLGAIFILIAGGLCVPSKDTWLYGGIYFFAFMLCFFISKSKKNNEYEDMFYDEDEEEYGYDDQEEPDYYYADDLPPSNRQLHEKYYAAPQQQEEPQENFIEEDTPENNLRPVANINNEPPKLRRRMSKYCPACGAAVSRESRFCPKCGTALSVVGDDLIEKEEPAPQTEKLELQEHLSENISPVDLEKENKNNEQIIQPEQEQPHEENNQSSQVQAQEIDASEVMPLRVERNPEFVEEAVDDTNFNMNDGEDMNNPNYRLVKPSRAPSGTRQSLNNNIEHAASSYQEFSKYTRKAKKRKRSAGRRVLSMLVIAAAVGGSLYFLLGLRKLPPGDLPPIARTEVIKASSTTNNNSASQNNTATSPASNIAETVEDSIVVAVPENSLPPFTPEREPRYGTIVGSNVNVRADHTTSSSRVTRLNVKTRVEILGNYNVPSGQYSGIWYNIRVGNNEGWVYGKYVQPTGAGLPEGYSAALRKSFGSNKTELINALGQPNKMNNTSAEWPGLTVALKGEDITRLRVTSSAHELQNGLKVGMSQTAVLQIMGYPSSFNNRLMQYNEGSKSAMSIQLDRNNTVNTITVN